MTKLEKLLQNAERYRRAQIILEGPMVNGRPTKDFETIEPSMMLEAFSSELFLKALIAMRTGVFARGHKLAKLFAKLDAGDRAAVRDDWTNNPVNARVRRLMAEHSNTPEPTFDEYLIANSEIFEKIRYYHEDISVPGQIAPGWLGESVRRYIYRLYPTEYQHVRLPLPPGFEGPQNGPTVGVELPNRGW